MNRLPLETRVRILSMLVEGSSMRSVSRLTGTSINTVMKLLVEAGEIAELFHDKAVHGLKTANLQCDEIWSFCYAKKANISKMKTVQPDAGDIWTFTGIDRDSKIIVSWHVGSRSAGAAQQFLQDTAARIDTPVQVSTDAFAGYAGAVAAAFPATTDYGQIIKKYSQTADVGPSRKYSPGVCIAADRAVIFGNPDKDLISTSHVERMNLNMRMGMRRFTRLTNAFSKKFENYCNALALYFYHYNFCRQHKTLGKTPAQAAGLTTEALTMEHLCKLMDAANAPQPRGPYKKREISN